MNNINEHKIRMAAAESVARLGVIAALLEQEESRLNDDWTEQPINEDERISGVLVDTEHAVAKCRQDLYRYIHELRERLEA